MVRRIGVLTSGGDAPGMNLAVVSVARCAAAKNIELFGIKNGYNGILGKAKDLRENVTKIDVNTGLDMEAMRGTWLRTARCLEFLKPEVREKAAKNLQDLGIDALVVIGGDGSFHGAQHLCKLGIPCVGIPGTIDNDLGYTEYTLGFDTAVGVCVDAVRSVRATSRSHGRPHVVEVMGRHCGDIATRTAMATGAEMLVVPEVRWSLEEKGEQLKKLIASGNDRATMVIAEHSWENMENFDWRAYLNKEYAARKIKKIVHPDEEITSHRIAECLSYMANCEARATVVGYTQRGATCSAQDGALAFESGYHAVKLLNKGKTNRAIGVKNGKIFDMDFDEALATERVYNKKMYDLINSL